MPHSSLRPADLVTFLRRHRYAVIGSIAPDGSPQSAVVGIAVSDRLEIVFDTLEDSRKARNLAHQPAVSIVIGSLEPGAVETVQYEGVVDRPGGAERERLIELYLQVFPDGLERQRWPGLTYFRARPNWIRYSHFGRTPPQIAEFDAAALASL